MKKTRQRVTGIGGFFFKAANAKKLRTWYRKHLGLPLDPGWGGWAFPWREAKRPKEKGFTVWSAFEETSDYFEPSRKPFMFNFRVKDLDRVCTELRAEGVWVDPQVIEDANGRFCGILDGEGNRIELWEPAAKKRKR